MLSATRRWFRRNRTPIAIGVGVVGAGYLATQYVLNKINDARERMSSDRIAKENLRRRFEQNQEDCTFTVLALLPTATTNILDAMNTEKITLEIQQMKSSKNMRSGASTAAPPSIADTTLTEEEGRSIVSFQSDSGVHASQVSLGPPTATGDGTQDDAAQSVPKPRKTKRQLWDDLTISSITRAFTLVYTLALLTLLTRIQLNLLGRRSYLSSVVSLATGTAQSTISLENNDDDNPEHAYGSDFETNRKYLTFSWWLLNRGWTDLKQIVERAVREVFGHLSPRDLVSFDTFSQLTMEVRKKVEGGTIAGERNSKWLSFLLPPTTLEDYVLKESGVLGDSAMATTASRTERSTPPPLSASFASTSSSTTPTALRRLLDETSDLIESPAFSHVLTLILDAGFFVLLNKKLLPGAFDIPAAPPSQDPAAAATERMVELEQQGSKVVLLPKILSVLTRQAHTIGNGMPNEYLQEMEQVRDLEAFAAVVYSSNWENEIHQEEQFRDQEHQQQDERRSTIVGIGGGGDEEDDRRGPSASRSTVYVGGGPTGAGANNSNSSSLGASEMLSSSGRTSQVSTALGGEESMVFLDPLSQVPSRIPSQPQSQTQSQASSFETAWERAVDRK
ncbi:Peroxin-3-domain-containing protein [Biscogniauxia mediterranea]|nr:Peroxin-3-domain-containing protein [Biscogniauxia mediterranea]